MAKQSREQGPTTSAHGPVQSRQPQAGWDCTSGQLWSSVPLITAPRSRRHWSTGQPIPHSFPIPILFHPSHHNNPTPSRPVLQHSSLLLEAACSYIFCCCSSASQISAELPKNACFGQTPALNKQTRAQKRHWVQGQIVKQRCIPVCSALAWGALQGAEKPGGVLVPNRPPQASPALASPKTPTHGTGGRVHPAHSAPLGGDMARTQHTRTYQLLLSQGELILVQT